MTDSVISSAPETRFRFRCPSYDEIIWQAGASLRRGLPLGTPPPQPPRLLLLGLPLGNSRQRRQPDCNLLPRENKQCTPRSLRALQHEQIEDSCRNQALSNVFAPDRACGGRCLVLDMEISAHVVRCPGHAAVGLGLDIRAGMVSAPSAQTRTNVVGVGEPVLRLLRRDDPSQLCDQVSKGPSQ